MSHVITTISTFFLGYFLALDLVYAVLYAISFVRSGTHMRRTALGGEDTILRSPFTPPISIVMPAFNEEATIVASVDALRLLEYGEFEIVVVDDGSTDSTLARLTEAYELELVHAPLRMQVPCKPIRGVYVSRRLPNLVVVSKENGGCKADASNAGINAARYPLVCDTDADAVLDKDALLRVVRPFVERPHDTVAVGGIVRIVNGCTVSGGRVVAARAPRNPLAAFQTVEYLRAFIASRTGWSSLGALFLVSGAFGVFRKDILVEVGGYSTDAIGEDMELIHKFHEHCRRSKRRYRIVFVPDPVVWTEAPETLKGLRSQRKRWHRGLLQCLVWHRRMTFRPRYGLLGMIALPYLWIFEAGGAVVETAGYVIMIGAAILGVLNMTYFVLFVLLAMVYGVGLSVTALLMDEMRHGLYKSGADIAKLLGYAVLENFGYRQLLTLWRFTAMLDWLMGKQHTWETLQRRGFKSD